MTANTVADGRMNNEQLGAFTRRVDEIKRRINEGTLSPFLVMRDLQKIVEGRPLMKPKLKRQGVHMGQTSIDNYLTQLSRVFSIHKHTVEDFSNYQYLNVPYRADFFEFSRQELGLDEERFNYQHLLNRALELDVEVGTIETGLMYALTCTANEITLGQFIVLCTQPLNVIGGRIRGGDHLLVIVGNQRPSLDLWPLEEVERVMGPSGKFVFMGHPYH